MIKKKISYTDDKTMEENDIIFSPKKSNNYLLMVIYFIFVTNPQITLIHFVQPYTEFVKRSNYELILRVN